MSRKVQSTSPGMRLQLGVSVLAAARAVDTRLVEARLASFDRAHRSYVSAQREVDTAESQLRAAQARLAECDVIQDEAVETLARALVGDGKPRANPFEPCGAPPPSALTRLPFAEAAQAVHQLVAAVQRGKGASPVTLEAATAAAEAARTVEEACAPTASLQDTVRDARRMRDAVAQGWESALAALRRGCRAAADDGAPDLYATLFPPVVRTRPKKPAEELPSAAQTEPAA